MNLEVEVQLCCYGRVRLCGWRWRDRGGEESPCEWMVGGELQIAGMPVLGMERGEELEEGLVVAGEVLVLCDVGGLVVLCGGSEGGLAVEWWCFLCAAEG